MKRQMVLVYIGLIFIALLANVLSKENYNYIFSNLICLLIVLSLQIIKSVFVEKEKNYDLLSLVEFILAISFLLIGQYDFAYILPVIIFDLLNKFINNILVLEFLSLMMNFALIKTEWINISIFSLLIYIYLSEQKKQIKIKEELKQLNKELRHSQYIMKKKMIDLDKYIEQNNIMTILKERNYIAQKMHDHLGHRITSSIMQLEVTKATIDKDKDTSIKYLDTAMNNLREGMEEIREFLKNIKPKEKVITIEDIREMIYKFQYNSGIKTSIEINGEIERVGIGLLDVFNNNIREALTNCAKYAHATEVFISFNIYRKIIRVEVRDNGKGCKKIVPGLGLRGIEERIKSVGGQVTYSNYNGFVLNMIASLEE